MKPPLSEIERDADLDRLRRRAGIRQEIARAQFLREQANALSDEAARLLGEVQVAADSHSAICGPLQDELRTLEAEAIEKIKSRAEPDPIADARRREIHGEIVRQNAELKAIRDRQNALARPLQAEAEAIRIEVAGLLTEAALASPTTANPKLLAQQFSIAQRIRWLDARREVAAEKVSRIEDSDVDRPMASKWRCELETVEREFAAAKADSQQIYNEIISE